MLESRRYISFVFAAVWFVFPCSAQLDTGTITVDVRDPTGSAIPGANVVLRNENTGINVRSGVTNEQGIFNAALIPSGSYAVHVELAGFKSYRQSNMYGGSDFRCAEGNNRPRASFRTTAQRSQRPSVTGACAWICECRVA